MDTLYQFKTNINCSGCVATVKPALDQTPGIGEWEVETEHPDKLLRVNSQGASAEEVMESVRSAGYRIERVG